MSRKLLLLARRCGCGKAGSQDLGQSERNFIKRNLTTTTTLSHILDRHKT